MSARSLGTHLSLSPMSARPVQAPKKGRDRDGHAPQHQLCADRLLSEFRADNLGRCWLVEVAAGGLAQSAHDLAHLLLGGRA